MFSFESMLAWKLVFCVNNIPVDTGRKLNEHKTFRRRLGRQLNVLYTFNLCPVSTGITASFSDLLQQYEKFSWTAQQNCLISVFLIITFDIFFAKFSLFSLKNLCDIYSIGLFRTKSNIYDEAFLRK